MTRPRPETVVDGLIGPRYCGNGSALDPLEIMTRRHLGWGRLEQAFLGDFRTPMCGDTEQIADVLSPLPSQEAARLCFELQDRLDAALTRAGADVSQAVNSALAEVEDLRPSLEHASQGGLLDVLEMGGVVRLIAASRAVCRLFSFGPHGTARLLRGWSEEIGSGRGGVFSSSSATEDRGGLAEDDGDEDTASLPAVTRVREALERAICWTAEGPGLRDDASDALRLARGRLGAAQRSLGVAAGQLVKQMRATKSLQDEFWTEREGRVVVPVRADGLHRLGDEAAIVHGSSGSGQTLFVEPTALVAKNNAVKAAQRVVRAETRKVLESLTSLIAEHRGALLDHQRLVASADELLARVRFAARIRGVSPTLAASDSVATYRLTGARHPGMLLDDATVVPFDVALEVGSALIVSGPNAGGKTVALKTLGLCVLLVKCGLRVPCEGGAELPWSGPVVTSVGDDQSIVASLSTFTAQLERIKMALLLASSSSPPLVLLDEIAAGTEPQQGAALAEAVVRALVERGATVLATTHYESLKLLGSQTDDPMYGRVEQASVGFDLERMAPTFELYVGAPGASSAIEVARRVGVDEAVLSRAEATLDPERVRLDELVRALSAERGQLASKLESLDEHEALVNQRARALDDREARLDARAARERLRAYDSAARELNAFEGEVRRRRKSLGRRGAAPEDREEQRALVTRGEDVLERHRPQASPSGVAPLEDVAVGDLVRVSSLGAQGEVVSIRGKRVEVQLAAVKTTVKRSELVAPEAPPGGGQRVKRGVAAPVFSAESSVAPTPEINRYFDSPVMPFVPGPDDVADLRGLRGEEAWSRARSHLGTSLARGRDVTVLLHGEGDGILRRIVRERLPDLVEVRRFRSGLPEEGGAAVTVVHIDV